MPNPETLRQWKPLVLCPDSGLEKRIRSALAAAGYPDVELARQYPAPGQFAAGAGRLETNVCFLDLASDQQRGLQLISEVSSLIPVVALNPNKDADLILRCLRRGACEFLASPEPDSVRALFERLSKARAPQAPKNAATAYCVVPGKPGCGATTVAVHLALHMRAAGKVLLVDTDVTASCIAFILKLKSEFHLGDVVRDWKRMDEDLWSRLITPFAGIDVVLAPDSAMIRLEIGRALAGEMIGFWKERYSTIVVDTPDLGVAVESGFLAQADQTLLVTGNDLSSLHATRRAIDFLDVTIGERRRLHLVVNRYTPAIGLKRDDLKTALQVEPFAVLSNDYDSVQEAILDGRPAADGSRFRSSIMALANQLQGKPVTNKRSPSWRGLLHLRK